MPKTARCLCPGLIDVEEKKGGGTQGEMWLAAVDPIALENPEAVDVDFLASGTRQRR